PADVDEVVPVVVIEAERPVALGNRLPGKEGKQPRFSCHRRRVRLCSGESGGGGQAQKEPDRSSSHTFSPRNGRRRSVAGEMIHRFYRNSWGLRDSSRPKVCSSRLLSAPAAGVG